VTKFSNYLSSRFYVAFGMSCEASWRHAQADAVAIKVYITRTMMATASVLNASATVVGSA